MLAGAGRTGAAYGRLVERSNPVDVMVPDSTPYGFTGSVDLDRIERFPEVASITRGRVILFTARTDDGRSFGSPDAVVVADRDDELGSTVERWTMIEGRRSNPDRVDEAVAGFTFAEDFGVHVGSSIELRLFRADTFRRAVGLVLSEGPARLRDGPAHVRIQFLGESLLLAGLGGLGGSVLGGAVTGAFAALQGWPYALPPWVLAGAAAATVLVGGIAGAYPASRAARLSSTAALATA